MSNIDKQQIRADIAIRKSMPGFGVSPDHSLARLKAIQETQRSFGLEVVEALLDELEAKDAQIANLTAERDALREGEMGDAKHSNTRAAADIYFQLVEECEIPAGGSLVEYVSELRERAAAGKGE